MALTRRALLEQIGSVGGVGATYLAMEALGLAMPTPAGAENFTLARAQRPRAARSSSSAPASPGWFRPMSCSAPVIGSPCSKRATASAGVPGRSAAATASSRPAAPTSSRPSIRGSISTPGPARIPSTHRVILGYARRFGVQLEPFINVNRNAGWDFGGKVQPERRMVEDMRGHLASCSPRRSTGTRSTVRSRRTSWRSIRQFLVPYGSARCQGHLHAPADRRAMRSTAAAMRRRRCRCRRSAFKELAPSPAVDLALSVRAYLGHAVDHAPAGRRHGSHRPRHLRAGEAGRAPEHAGHGHPPHRRSGSDRAWARQASDRGRLLHLHAAAADLLANIPSDFSPAKKAALKTRALSAQREGGVRSAALLGNRRQYLRRPRLDRSRQ